MTSHKTGEVHFQTIFDSVNDAIFVHDLATGAILDVNQRMCELYGYTHEEALHMDVGMLSSGEPPYTQQEALQWMQKAAAGDPQLFVWRARSKNGHLFWCEVSMRRARMGKNDRLLVTTRDITERMLVKEEISRLAAIVESSNDAIIGKTLEGIIFSWNAGAERLYGYSKAEAIGSPISFLLPPGRHDDLPRVFDCIRRGEGVNYFETERRTKDGRIIEVSLTISPIRNALGQIVGASTIARDITERKQAKERLKESENRLSAILRSIQTGIVIIDPETHHIVEANATALRWIGALREEVVGSVCHKFICPAEIGRCPITDLGQTVNNSERVLLTITGRECPIIKTASYVTIGGRQHLLESFVDITEQKRAEEELKFTNVLLSTQQNSII